MQLVPHYKSASEAAPEESVPGSYEVPLGEEQLASDQAQTNSGILRVQETESSNACQRFVVHHCYFSIDFDF